MTRASELSCGQVIIDGVKNSGDNFGHPVRLLCNMPKASLMRVGNTIREMELSSWRDYAAESLWFLRTGMGTRTIYAQFKDGNDAIVTTSALAPDYGATPGSNVFPNTGAIALAPLNGAIWEQHFEEFADFWAAYDYSGGMPGGGNVFYPASHEPVGGSEQGGYIWADDSRWRIDTPENPHSILALLTYPKWIVPGKLLSIFGKKVSFYLRGDSLDLKGGQAFFWVLDATGRYHKRNQPLNIGSGAWGSKNSITIGTIADGWHHSWGPTYPLPPMSGPDFTNVHSWGVSFTGFPEGVKPTGILRMSDFRIGA